MRSLTYDKGMIECALQHYNLKGFAEAAGTEENVEEIADVELDCTGMYSLVMWNDSRLSLAV